MKRHLLPQIKCFFLLALLLTVAVGAKAEGINVTSADIGKVLCTDGSIYNDEWEPTRYGKTPVAMIAYVDTENGKGLAIALKNAKDEGTWNDAQTDIANWISSKGYTLTGLGMTWKLPTKADWQNMIIGCGGSIDATSGQMDFTDLQEKLYAVTDHALTLQNYYWTADEYDEYNVYNLHFDCMSMTANFSYCMPTNYNSFYTHACIDFNVAEPVSIVATTADVGKLLCTDGSIYPSVSEAVAAGKTVAAMIAYVDKQSKKGLALALADEVEVDNGVSSNTLWWDNAVGAANTHTPIIGGATWRLPTIDDWQNMLVGCGDVTNDGYDYTYDKINDKLSSAGAPLQQGYYWSSTIIDNDALLAHFENDVATLYSSINPHDNHQYYARACLDFDVADALEPDFAVTTSDLGKVVCTDGSIYDSVAAAEADSKTPVGMIAFVDMEQETGLVIALNDDCHIINEGTVYEQTDDIMDKATATTVAGAHTPAINDNLWRLPTIEEWKQMLLGTDPDGTGVNDFTFSSDYLNNNLAAVGGFQLEGYYWSSTLTETQYGQEGYYANFNDNPAYCGSSTGLSGYLRVRACFRFNVALTKYDVSINNYFASYVTSNKTKAAEGETVGLTISNIPKGKYVYYVSVGYEIDGYWYNVDAYRSNYDDNVFTFTMPAYPVTVDYVYFEDIQVTQVIDGLYYTLNNQYGTAEVAPHPDHLYSGSITVPATVKPSYWTYSVTAIGQEAFAGYNNNEITSVTLGTNVRTIRRDAFYNTTLTSLSLGEHLTTIEQYAFRNGNYPIAIPSTVDNISRWAFKGYKGTSMSVAAGNATFDSRGNCNAIIETAENMIVAGCSATTIPATVTMIGEAAFDGVGLTSISIPSNVTTLDMGAFANNPMTAVTIPATVTTIYNNPFYGCDQLANITVANGNPNYDSRNGCNAICDTKRNWIIASCKNTVIPTSITGISTFSYAYRQDLKEFKVPSHISVINDNAFAYSNLWNVTLTDNDDLTIGRWAFGQCKELRTVKIGRGIRNIDEQVFMGCSNLSHIYVNAPLIPKVKNITFEVDDAGNITTAKVHVPSAALRTYQKANFWKDLNLVASNNLQGVKASFKKIQQVPSTARGKHKRLRGGGIEVNLITEEGAVWRGSYIGGDTEPFSIDTYGGEPYLQIGNGDGNNMVASFFNCSDMGFTISGSVKKVIVKAAGNECNIKCEIVDISENPDNATADQTQSISKTATNYFEDYTLDFSGKEYSKALVNVVITGKSEFYLGGISIVQGGGDYVITEQNQMTVQGIEYSNSLSAPASAEEAEAIIDGDPVYVYTTCLPTAPQTSEGLKYYTLNSSTETSLQFVEIEGAPQANTPYLVAVSSDTELTMSIEENVKVTLQKESSNSSSTNAFKFVGTTTGLTNAEAAAKNAYILQDGNLWGLVTTEEYEAYIPPFRAYIVPRTNAARRILKGGFGSAEDDQTVISTMQLTDRDGTTRYFDLNGRPIAKPAAKGIYVTNGKKILNNK